MKKESNQIYGNFYGETAEFNRRNQPAFISKQTDIKSEMYHITNTIPTNKDSSDMQSPPKKIFGEITPNKY